MRVMATRWMYSRSRSPYLLTSMHMSLIALLRRRAEDVKLPLERLATGVLIDYLYSKGELSIPQYDLVRELMPVR